MSMPTFAKQTHLIATRIAHHSLVWGVVLACLWGGHPCGLRSPPESCAPLPWLLSAWRSTTS